jgi:hypothetical protein
VPRGPLVAVDRLRVDADELPLDTADPHDAVDHQRIAGGDGARLLDLGAAKHVRARRLADVLPERAAEEDRVAVDQGVDEVLVGRLVQVLVTRVRATLEQDEDVGYASPDASRPGARRRS